jgi:hypothetical protein
MIDFSLATSYDTYRAVFELISRYSYRLVVPSKLLSYIRYSFLAAAKRNGLAYARKLWLRTSSSFLYIVFWNSAEDSWYLASCCVRISLQVGEDTQSDVSSAMSRGLPSTSGREERIGIAHIR